VAAAEVGAGRKMSEPKPEKPGTEYGQLSPQAEWYWDGTGREDDDWAPVNPDSEFMSEEEYRACPICGEPHIVASSCPINDLQSRVAQLEHNEDKKRGEQASSQQQP
jgi:hypothetical protein